MIIRLKCLKKKIIKRIAFIKNKILRGVLGL